jgi:hypothetical protein
MNRTRRNLATAVAVACLTAAACSDDDPDTTAPTDAPTTTAATTTTTTTTIVAPTTSTAPTTTPPTTTAPPTDPPTTTIDLPALQAEVEAAYREAWELYIRAGKSPSDSLAVDAALSRRSGEARTLAAEALGELAELNQRITDNPQLPGAVAVERPAVLDPADRDRAEIQVCEIDPWIRVEIGTGPGGSDAVVDSETYAYRSVERLVRIDGEWLLEESILLGEWVGISQCPAE